jgi:hypothetical protein
MSAASFSFHPAAIDEAPSAKIATYAPTTNCA